MIWWKGYIELSGAADIDGVPFTKVITEILDDSDGCAEQYRCATSLYMLQKLATERNIIYNRASDQ